MFGEKRKKVIVCCIRFDRKLELCQNKFQYFKTDFDSRHITKNIRQIDYLISFSCLNFLKISMTISLKINRIFSNDLSIKIKANKFLLHYQIKSTFLSR